MRHHKLTAELGFKPRLALLLLLINKHGYRCHKALLRKEGRGANPGLCNEHMTGARGVTVVLLLQGSPLNPHSLKL